MILTNNAKEELVTIIYFEIDIYSKNEFINLSNYRNVEIIIIDIQQGEKCFLPINEFSFYVPSKIKKIKINSKSFIYFTDNLVNLLCDKIKINTLDLSNCSGGSMMPDKFCSIENILLNKFIINTYLSYGDTTHSFGKVDFKIRTKNLICSYLNPKYLNFLLNLPLELENIRINFREMSSDDTSDYYYDKFDKNNIVNFLNNIPSNIKSFEIHKSWNVDLKKIIKIPFNCKLLIFD